MKKLYSFVAACLLVGSMSVNAQEYYPKYILNQDFNGIEALPAGWSGDTNAKTTVFNGNGGFSIADNALKTNGNGSGNRGVDIMFPGVDTTMVQEHPVLCVEFDWRSNAGLNIGAKNTYGFALTGSGVITNTANWYTPAIFGLYFAGSDKAVHYWNLDPLGPEDTTTLEAHPEWYGLMGPMYLGSPTVNTFNRVGPASALANLDSVNLYNESTRALELPALDGVTVHIKAMLDFEKQLVTEMTLSYDVDTASGSVTFTDMPFLAPYMIGADTTVVAKEDRIVRDMERIASVGTRSTANGLGNGGNTNFDVRMDNFQVYYLKESQGTRDIAVKFVDQNGAEAKASIVYAKQQIGEELIINAEDLVSFGTETSYYAFDAEATAAANPSATSYKTMPVTAESNEFILVFKKYPKATGVLTWTGKENNIWNELFANFKDEAGVEMGYQQGVAVALPAAAADSIFINETISMDAADLTIDGAYILGGSSLGKIEGTGNITVNAGATFNTMTKLAMTINTRETVTFGTSTAAASIAACDEAVLSLTTGENFSIPVTGAGADASITILPASANKDQEYSMAIKNVGTVNYGLNTAGRRTTSDVRFRGAVTATYPNATDSTPVVLNLKNVSENKVKNTLWENDGTPIPSWGGTFRFGLEGNDGNNECIATFPADVWSIIKEGTVRVSVDVTESSNIRITTGWWSAAYGGTDHNCIDFVQEDEDGTKYIELNIKEEGSLYSLLDQQHLLFSGDAYTILAIYTEGSGDAFAGFGAITKEGLRYAKLNLGEKVKLNRYYNETDNEVDYLGSVNGAEGSLIESGWVDGRHATYRIGGLGEDNDFAGDIRSFQTTDTTYSTSVIYLVKEGEGKLTLSGELAFNGTIEAAGGTLDMSGATFAASLPMNWATKPDTAFATVITSLTVDSAATVMLPAAFPIATLQANNNSVVYSANADCAGNVQIGGKLYGGISAYEGIGFTDATVFLNVTDPKNGLYESIVSGADIELINTKLVISVLAETDETVEIPVLSAEYGAITLVDGYFDVAVNGINVLEVKGSEGAGGFDFNPETGILTCYAGPLSLRNATKEVASVECYDLLGVRAAAESKGILIRKTTFNDGTVQIEKIINVK